MFRFVAAQRDPLAERSRAGREDGAGALGSLPRDRQAPGAGRGLKHSHIHGLKYICGVLYRWLTNHYAHGKRQ